MAWMRAWSRWGVFFVRGDVGVRRRKTLFLAALLIATSSVCVATQEQAKFNFAEKSQGPWRFRAITEMARPANAPPYVRETSCEGSGPDGQFSMNGSGGINDLRLSFMGDADEDGEREQITLTGDHLWLFIDGEKWEYANIPLRTLFTNVEYPKSNEDMILTWRGHQAVRKNGVGPWLHFSRFQERLLNAKKTEWSYKSRNWDDVGPENDQNKLPKGWKSQRYIVNVAPFKFGVEWCVEQLASDAAFQLPVSYHAAKGA
jgi:hypothetical protein